MRKGISITVSAADRRRLEAIVADRSSPQNYVWRAGIILLTEAGLGTMAIMCETGKSKTCVWRWQERFMEEGVAGLLRDKTRPSRIAPLAQAKVDEILALTKKPPAHEATHWTGPAMAKAVGVSVSSVQRVWRCHGLQPHRLRLFKLSNDPAFADKIRDVVGLYVDPPAHAVVLSVDEKSQIQALDRSQPGLPMKKGRCGTMTHDYKRNGTTTLFRRPSRRPKHAASPPSGVHPLSQCHRARCSSRQGHPRDPRQLRHPQASQGQAVAAAASQMDLPFHPDIELLAQCRRGLLRQAHQAATQTRRFPLNRRPPGRHKPLHRGNQ
jgi:transposase